MQFSIASSSLKTPRYQGLRLTFGEHRNALVEQLMVTEPRYLLWISDPATRFRPETVPVHIRSCFKFADHVGFPRARCETLGCVGIVGIMALYYGSTTVRWLCGRCAENNINDTCIQISTLRQCITIVSGFPRPKVMLGKIMPQLWDAKGMKRPRTEAAVLEFFNRRG